MPSKRKEWQGIAVIATAAAVWALVVVLFNIGGWRARILARFLRVENQPVIVLPPPNFQPRVPPGFKVSVFARGFTEPRWLAVAPNGDVFVADSAAGQVVVLHDPQGKGYAESRDIFADRLKLPFGIAFHDEFVFIADTNEVLRFRYDPQTSKRLGDAEHILDLLRNAVGIAVSQPAGALWATVNERDDVGDDLPPDYFTHVSDGGFYGWPYAYVGGHADDRVSPRPDLVRKMITPDLLLDAHAAPLQFSFYEKQQFPSAYWQGAFIAEHGSWNRRVRTGYQVVFVPFRNGSPAGKPVSFFSGFVPDAKGKNVYGRMVGVAVAADGSLFISDDAGKVIWRVAYGSDPAAGAVNSGLAITW
jgi:glucose/arabinose dehydrogenase